MMIRGVAFEWDYQPADYFEAEIGYSDDSYNVAINNGVARVVVEANFFDGKVRSEGEAEIARKVRGFFEVVRVRYHKSYKLNSVQKYQILEDGSYRQVASPRGLLLQVTVDTADCIVRDAQGNVTRDTKKERLSEKRRLAASYMQYSNDAILSHMLESHHASSEDPRNELVHLYEVRDAVLQHFGSKREACLQLDLSLDEWSNFGRICNREPLRQGRHRGSHSGELRQADRQELEISRQFAGKITLMYLRYLENLKCAEEPP